MKKMLKVFGIVAVVLCIFISVVACDNSGKKGIEVIAISKSEYSTVADAIKGYVKEELAFSNEVDEKEVEIVVAEYVSHESKGEVTPNGIDLSAEQKSNFVSAEKVAVKAKVAMVPNNETEKPVFSEVTQTVYVLKYGEKYKFMVSTPELGERVTNSYVKMLTNTAKYENCTISGISKNKEEDSEAVFARGSEIKFADNAMNTIFYLDETRYNTRTPGGDKDIFDKVAYVVKNNADKIVGVSNNYNSEGVEVWEAIAMNDPTIKTIKEYNAYALNDQLFSLFTTIPAALYTKTETGFKFYQEEVDEDGDKETYEYNITISDDKITNIYFKEAYIWTDEDGTYEEYYDQSMSIGSFGSTTITVPDAVKTAANN